MTVIRDARDEDVDRLRDLFVRVYGEDYPFPGFYDTEWLKRSVYDDSTIFLIAENEGQVVATGSAMLSAGGLDDLVCEFGRLVSANSKRARGAAVDLCAELMNRVEGKVQFTFAEVRTLHPGSQRLGEHFGWKAVGFEPMKYQFARRESVVLYANLHGYAAELRRNHPHVIPEIALLAQTALANLELPGDAIIVDETDGYPTGHAFKVDRLRDRGITSLLRIERGRVTHREIFGNFSLSHGFFRIANSNSHYLVARDGEAVLGAVGFTHDPIDSKVRIFELIEFDDAVKGYLLASVDRIAREEFGAAYQEVDVSAYSPKIQRTFERLGFVPVAYMPSMVFDNVERLDIVRMAKLCLPYDPGAMRLLGAGTRMRAIVEEGLQDRLVGAEIGAHVRKGEFFRDLPEGELHHLCAIALLREFRAGTLLLRQGDAPDRLYILAEGAAEVWSGDQVVATLAEGAVLGEMGLLEKKPRSADVVLTTDAKLVEIEMARLERLMETRPRLGFVVTRNLARSLSAKLRRMPAGHVAALKGK